MDESDNQTSQQPTASGPDSAPSREDLKRRGSHSSSSRPTQPKRSRSHLITPDANNGGPGGKTDVQSTFAGFRDEIDLHNDRRDRLIKTSRDVTSLSKKLIFHLHRYQFPTQTDAVKGGDSTAEASKNAKLFAEAEKKRDEIVKLLKQTAEQEGLNGVPIPTSSAVESTAERTGDEQQSCGDGGRAFRYERNLGGGLEEFIEALSFHHFLLHGTLITYNEVRGYLSPSLFVPIDRYLLGLSDLTGELMRLATNAVGSGAGSAYVNRILALLRSIRDGLDPFVPFIRDMKKKQTVTNQSVRKVEDVMYAIAVRTSEFAQDPKALAEMVRRTLSAPATGGRGESCADDDE